MRGAAHLGRPLLVCLAAGALLAACGGRARTGPPPAAMPRRSSGAIAPGEVLRVRGVDIVGNEDFGDGDIVDRLATRPPSGLIFRNTVRFDPLALRLDEERVVAFYRERGYFAAEVEDVRVRRAGGDRVDVTIHVREGEPTYIAGVLMRGAPAGRGADEATLRAAIPLRAGQTLRHPDFLEARDQLGDRLREAGYAHARVVGRVLIDRDRRLAWPRFDLDPGPLVRFGPVRVAGAPDVPRESVHARLAFDEGDVYDPDRLRRSQANLLRLGVFGTVRFDPPEDRGATLPLTLRVTEARRHELRFGGGVSLDQSRFAVRGRAGYTVRSWLLPLLTLSAEARPGYVVLPGSSSQRGFTGEASLLLRKDDFLTPLVAAEAEASYELQVREAYSILGPRLRLGLERQLLDQDLFLRLGWNIMSLDLVDDEAGVAAALGDVSPLRVAALEQQALYDGRDDALVPRRGLYLALRVAEAGGWAGGAFDYIKVQPEARGYLPLGGRTVAAALVRTGRFFGTDGTPFTERFYGGGVSGMRGFGYRRLSPMVRLEDGELVPVGGEAMLESSAELRVDVFKIAGRWVGLAGFLDAGDVTRRSSDLSLSDLHYAAGLGISYLSVAGPVRLDAGFRLNRLDARVVDGLEVNPDPGDRFAIHLSLGAPF